MSDDVDATIPRVDDRTVAIGSPAPDLSSTSTPSFDGGEFSPGTMFAGRYRIVAHLGSGGMGGVYRADDLTLGQPVALKFLPADLTQQADRKARFYQEVRTARELSHPNVCRVYDIGEANGRLFLSMEFVDGEDLASLLRRIGRFPLEKGVDIARQLCAGLSALHEKGVLHRDLKPANVMVDGEGRVRITDFGLSAFAGHVAGAEIRAGTPAYMSPEQITGQSVDRRSDLYSLGLVLHEIFTGKRVFTAETVRELTELQLKSSAPAASTILPGIDPTVERVIEQCLEKDPELRPASALAVAAALPGGSPLAAALAAGEIPSAELVAASGEAGGMKPAWALGCLVAVLAGFVIATVFGSTKKIAAYDPLQKPTPVLIDRAREVLLEVGYDQPFDDSAHGYFLNSPALAYLRDSTDVEEPWEEVRDASPAAVSFWYRQSPRQLMPRGMIGSVTRSDPPFSVPHMAEVLLDTKGRLQSFRVVPPQRDAPSDSLEQGALDWETPFRLAGLDFSKFEQVEPQWLPLLFADDRRAWTGPQEGSPVPVRVEVGSYRDWPVSFEVIGPWKRAFQLQAEEESLREKITTWIILGIIIGVLLGTTALAVRNVRLGRGDQRGAMRLSVFMFVLSFSIWMIAADHVSHLNDELNFVLRGIAVNLLNGAIFFAFYLALEPYLRKFLPERMVAWSRLAVGRFRDPLIGRDVLIGGFYFLYLVLTKAVLGGLESDMPKMVSEVVLSSVAYVPLLAASNLINSVYFAIFFLLVLIALRVVLRSALRGAALFVVLSMVLFGVSGSVEGWERVWMVLGGLAWSLGVTVVLFRFGMIPFAVGSFLEMLVSAVPLTFDSSRWFFNATVLAAVLIFSLMAFAYTAAVSRRAMSGAEASAKGTGA